MNREPHIVTPAQDAWRQAAPDMGTPAWWRRVLPKKPAWWDRVFAQPWEKADG